MRTVQQALDTILQQVTPTAAERVGLVEADGRVLARDVIARVDSPAFDNSAMDGYALRAADASEAGVELPVCGESRAGGPAPRALPPGSAMRIYTGAPLPPGADTVVIQEDTERVGERVRLHTAVKPHAHVRARGSDLAAGARALAAGSVLGPGELAVLASQNHASADVARRPRVAILSTGDELRDIGEPDESGSIVNSNAYMLAAQVRRAGAEPWVLPPAPDVREEVAAQIEQGLTADVLLCSGGVSVGEHDVVRGAMQDAGVSLCFWKVAMKPGKPLSFGIAAATPVIGLPGNPVSAFVGFELFVRPALRRMLGDRRPHLSRVPVRLASAHRHKPGRLELARARLHAGPQGFVAQLAARQGSGALPALADVDALVLLPAEQESFPVDRPVDALLLRGPGAERSPFEHPAADS